MTRTTLPGTTAIRTTAGVTRFAGSSLTKATMKNYDAHREGARR
ncbi:MAG TPA: hypothetical protein VFK52_06575 [Nocardioidaceae bacterium]|nr:hypothetical protein [Nocardioidaceae bacterium]